MRSPAGQLAAVLDSGMALATQSGQILCSQGRRLIKQMLVNKQVIGEMNLHLSIKKLYLNCCSYRHINLVSEMSTYGKRANMWQMGNLSSIAFAALPEWSVTMATKFVLGKTVQLPNHSNNPIFYPVALPINIRKNIMAALIMVNKGLFQKLSNTWPAKNKNETEN